MQETYLLTFEICTGCNLGIEHEGKCPNMRHDRYRSVDASQPLSDDKIVGLVEEAYKDLGFTGSIAFHYYNEPLVAKNRMLAIVHRIKETIPQATFVLWTNGELISAECSELACFNRAYITSYHGLDFERVKKVIPKVTVSLGVLDCRLDAKGYRSSAPCKRMSTEFIVDYYGNVHICCVDWRGEVKVGNVRLEPFPLIVNRWCEIREQISGRRMRRNAPETCRRCLLRVYPKGYAKWRENTWQNVCLLVDNPVGFLRKSVYTGIESFRRYVRIACMMKDPALFGRKCLDRIKIR